MRAVTPTSDAASVRYSRLAKMKNDDVMRRTDTAQRIISAAVKYDTAFFIFCDHETSDLSVPRSFSRKKHPRTHLQRPDDVFTDAEASLSSGRLNIELRRTYRRPRTDTARNFRIFMMQSEAARTSKNEPRRISRYGKRCTDALKRTVRVTKCGEAYRSTALSRMPCPALFAYFRM